MVGPGAIGLAVVGALEAAGRRPVLHARRPIGRMRLVREGAPPTELQARVLVGGEGAEPVDGVLLAVKAHQTAGAGELLRRLTSRETTVVVLQNGVRDRDRVAEFVGDAAVLPASVWLGAEVADGEVRVVPNGPIRVPAGEAGDAFRALFAGSWLDVEPTADFELDSWRKLTVNAAAGLMALSGRRAAMFRLASVQELARRLALECAAVARAEGVPLADDEALRAVEALAAAPPDLATSILVDRERGVPLEWEARNGVVRELGRRHGVPTPVSDVVVPLLEAASGPQP